MFVLAQGRLLRSIRVGLLVASCVLLASLAAARADEAEVIERCKAATVLIDVPGFGTGSGFCIRDNGLFLSNAHVVEDVGVGGKVRLVLNSGEANEQVLSGRVLKLDAETDLALIQASEAKGLTALRLRPSSGVRETLPVTVFGYPFGRFLSRDERGNPSISVNTGKVSALRKAKGKLEAIQIDAAVNPGNSGGPVVDDQGRVIGVVVSGVFLASGVSFAIPSDVASAFLSQPAVLMTPASVEFARRGEPQEFALEVFALTAAAEPDALRVEFTDAAGTEQNIEARRDGKRFAFEAAPFAASEAASGKLQLACAAGGRRFTVKVDDGSLKIGTKELRLSELRTLERRADAWIATRLSGAKLAGPVSGWPAARDEQAAKVDWAEVDRVEIAVEGAVTSEVSASFIAQRRGKTIATVKSAWKLSGSPRRADDDSHHPRDPQAIALDRLEVEVRIDGESFLHLTPDGLFWEHRSFDKPGLPDGSGHKSTVNGKPWRYEWQEAYWPDGRTATVSQTLPLKLPQGEWEVTLVSLKNPGTRVSEPERGYVACSTSPFGHFVIEFNDVSLGSGDFRVLAHRTTRKVEPTLRPKTPTAEQTKLLRANQEAMGDVERRIAAAVAKIDYKDPADKSAGPAPQDFVWIDDELPAGANVTTSKPWEFAEAPQPVLSGKKSSRRTAKGLDQHFFEAADPGLCLGEGDVLYAHVYLDPADPPRAVMLQFSDGSWEHRGYWGEDVIEFGVANTPAHAAMGPLPKPGEWARLEVPAASVNLPPGTIVRGFAFTQFDGTVHWDQAGIRSSVTQVGQTFDSQFQWEAAEAARALPLAPPEVHEALRVAAGERDERQQQLLRGYFLQQVCPATRETFAPLRTERARLIEQAAQIDAEIPGGPSFAGFAGAWLVYYENGGVREYVLHDNGNFAFPAESRQGRLSESGTAWLLDLGDGKLERLRFFGTHTARFEHFNPAAKFGTGEFLGGIARRKITVRAAVD